MANLPFVTSEASRHLNIIASMFKDGAKLTLLVRTPRDDEADFCLTNDDLDEAIKGLERRKEKP